MVTKQTIDAQLKRLGVTVKGWGTSELLELSQILMPNEEITGYAHGWYESGFATLIATTERLLLIDKKLFHLTIEDVRYDMIAEVDYSARLWDATIRVNSLNKCLRFTSFKPAQLRALTNYIQQRVMEMRHHQMYSWQQSDPAPVPDTPGLPIVQPDMTPMRRLTTSNPYAKQTLTTKHNFLPKVPRRFRPA